MSGRGDIAVPDIVEEGDGDECLVEAMTTVSVYSCELIYFERKIVIFHKVELKLNFGTIFL